MSAGSVLGRIVLNHPTKYHCGTDDAITGHVALTYRPLGAYASQSTNGPAQELFGPLKIFLTFGGRAKTKIHKSNGNTSSTHRGRAPLFSQHHKIHDGPYTSKAGECVRFPFSLNFPAATQHLPGQGDFRQDVRFQEEAGHPLPPTFAASNTGFSKSFKAFVEYRLNAEIRMPGIDISVLGLNQGDEGIPILYEQPRLPASEVANFKSRKFSDFITLQNEHLLPEEQRPTGFRQKAKFAFSSERYPTYQFTLRGAMPTEIFVGQPIILELNLDPDHKSCNAPVPPTVQLRWVRAGVRQYINIRAEHGFFSAEESNKDYHLPCVPCFIVEPQVPFCKANDNTKFIHTTVLNTASSFSTYNICQRYTLEIQYGIHAAGKDKTLKHIMPVTVHPPVDDSGLPADAYTGGYAGASSSAIPPPVLDNVTQDPQTTLPPPTTLGPATGLPEYERPPEYHEVLDMTTENDAAESSQAGRGKAVAS